MINYAALKAEVQNDPRGYGYAADVTAGNDQAVADRLNLARDGSAGRVPASPTADGGLASGVVSVPRVDVDALALLGVIDVRDFITNANNLQSAWFESVTQSTKPVQLANADGSKTFTRQNIDRAVGNTNGSQGRLDALAVKAGSRLEELSFRGAWGVYFASANDVSKALRGT